MPLNPPITEWKGKRVWIVGASSGIGAALAHALVDRGARVAVSARGEQQLATLGAEVVVPMDVRDAAAIREAADVVVDALGGIDLAVYCAGTYTPMRATALELDTALDIDDINYRGALRWLAAVIPAVSAQGSGHLSLVSSVAGWRGLPQALAYGPTKAALINLAETLHIDLRPLGIGVSVVNPGFVETPLTARNAFHMPALIKPEAAARAMIEGWRRGSFDIHFPKRFTRWMRLLRGVPDRLYFAATRRVTG